MTAPTDINYIIEWVTYETKIEQDWDKLTVILEKPKEIEEEKELVDRLRSENSELYKNIKYLQENINELRWQYHSTIALANELKKENNEMSEEYDNNKTIIKLQESKLDENKRIIKSLGEWLDVKNDIINKRNEYISKCKDTITYYTLFLVMIIITSIALKHLQ